MNSTTSSTTQALLSKYASLYKETTQHQLTNELCQGTLNDRTLYVYLAQDLIFFETSLRLICKATSLAPESSSLLTLAKKIGFFANDENTYFRDCLKYLEPAVPSENERQKFLGIMLPGVDKYIKFINESVVDTSMTYAQYITIIWACEQIYLSWAHDSPKKENLHWKYQTWIDLHDGEHFISWCDFLEAEVNKFSIEEVEKQFTTVLQHEYNFFDNCYKA
ncbi:similar to Saccharomyces cerevisiae YCR020C PET18 Protein of unknown function, has weak similarity to proteins involved in thiamin metabolism [Maudiozyma barnettii]|uniref:Thiaminase-2/PQQC domain-containing protein n=1 Tax=Maudiozyma barnettii TaxID=61262 RepID=A0A8H2VFK9_9SACH|nr:Pet18p [Kazachstania barnettii]CAB4254681.1 similar to Saccharomyces cerevisiae YCR020C PET18 Protein of unknown function, has weak similarity to proteins involved in thiamin metabolism [Kazachstania barnettii]CAD1782723.1 similar to Saccharomyces cerevisiae YCR020C PET18 Protein of unknown function, has weak similarity to proteins involved in thiamin metabolism [Kazachstania barnettii]